MESVLLELLKYAGTAIISFGIAWARKKANIKAIKNGSKTIDQI